MLARAWVLVAAGALGCSGDRHALSGSRRIPAGLRREAEAAAVDGFAGKILIHPAQIDIVNAAFTPSPGLVRWAERVNDAFTARPDAGVFALDGKMIDRPHWKLAQQDPGRGGTLEPAQTPRIVRVAAALMVPNPNCGSHIATSAPLAAR